MRIMAGAQGFDLMSTVPRPLVRTIQGAGSMGLTGGDWLTIAAVVTFFVSELWIAGGH